MGNSTLIEVARYCANLTSLDITGNHITDEALHVLVQHNTGLKSLHLSTSMVTTQCLVSVANRCTALTSLGLTGRVEAEAAQAFGMNCGDQLQRLVLNDVQDNVALMALFQHCYSLTELDVSGSTGMRNDVLAVVARQNPNLRKIELCGCYRLTDAAIHALANHCRHLRSLLGVPSTSITDATLTYLVERCPALRELQGWSIPVSDRVVSALAENCPHLQILTSCDSSVTNKTLIALAVACPKLTHLALARGPSIRANKALIRALSKHCRRLRHVEIGECDAKAAVAIKLMIEDRKQKGVTLAVEYTAQRRWFECGINSRDVKCNYQDLYLGT